jgi:hypothetical protein
VGDFHESTTDMLRPHSSQKASSPIITTLRFSPIYSSYLLNWPAVQSSKNATKDSRCWAAFLAAPGDRERLLVAPLCCYTYRKFRSIDLDLT